MSYCTSAWKIRKYGKRPLDFSRAEKVSLAHYWTEVLYNIVLYSISCLIFIFAFLTKKLKNSFGHGLSRLRRDKKDYKTNFIISNIYPFPL